MKPVLYNVGFLRMSLLPFTLPNKGIGGVRNAGIRYTNGVFVAFLDSDDFWLEKKLEFVADYIKKVE